jgi:PAS domain S-box-containing protein
VVLSADDNAKNSKHRRMPLPAASPSPGQDVLSWAFQFADLCGFDLILVDPESGQFFDCNASALQTLGYSREELLAMGPAHLQADDHHDPVWVTQRLRQLLKEGRGSFPTRHRCRDGTAVDVRVNLITVNHNGRPVVVSLVETIRNAQLPNPHLDQQLLLFQETEAIHGSAGWHHRLHCGTMGWTPQI